MNVMNKVIDLKTIAKKSNALRRAGKRLVATNGCFDLLHVGHVRYLQKARSSGDALVVGINGDESVRNLKGAGRPINHERDRAEVLAALESVDWVVIFPETRATRFLEAAAPAVYAKGGDYSKESLNPEECAALEKSGTKIEIIPFESGYSTTGLLERLQKNR